MRHVSEVIPVLKRPMLFKRNAIHRAQGMAAYVSKDFPASPKTNNECRCHEVQVFKVCGKTNKSFLFSIFQTTDTDDSIFDWVLTSMAAIKNFNAHYREWLSSLSPANCHGLRVFEFASEAGCEQLVCMPTHRSGNCLDLVFTDTPGVVDCNVGIPIESSDLSINN